MAKKKAVKNNRKSNHKLRRTVFGTLSGIFMISALIVAAIPVKDVEAVEEDSRFTNVYEADPDAVIPEYGADTPVYFSNDGLFGAAYVNRQNSAEMVGVLAYYDSNSSQAPSNLVIKEEFDAFQYDDNDRLCAVYGDRQFLYYISREAETDVSGNQISEEEIAPCLASNMSEWQDKPLYASADGMKRGAQQSQINVKVSYIGSTKYQVNWEGSHIQVTYGPDQGDNGGVFQGARNFSALSIPEHILAIGNNAFRECQMQSVSVANKVLSIGNHAFDGCNRLNSVTLANQTSLEEIGAYAFAGCVALQSISIPDQVIQIGAGCFMNCTSLSAVNLYGSEGDGNTSLQYLGDGVFYNCSALTGISLPNILKNVDEVDYLFYDCSSLSYLGLPVNVEGDKTFNASNVTGCSGLVTVHVPNREMTFECDCLPDEYKHKYGDGAGCTFGWANLGVHTAFPKEYEVDERFCIMTYRNSAAYEYACDHEYSVGYLDAGHEGEFERVKGNYFFCVNENNELIKFSPYEKDGVVVGDPAIVDIPDNIGNHYISGIGSDTFRGNTDIEYVHIPASVTSIAENSFKGCTNLTEVEFADALTVESIGEDAFRTLATDDSVQLRFVGTISLDSEPYVYAMKTENNYNATSLPTKYISYTSQFPSNLQVELYVEKDEVTGEITKAVPTLVAAPTYEQFQSGDYSLSSYERQAEEQNDIVRSAYSKYRGQTVSGNSLEYSEDEQAVLDAVFRVSLPAGIYGMDGDVYKGNTHITSAVLNSVVDVPDEAFAGCSALETFIMRSSGMEGGESLGDKVFDNDDQLTTIVLPSTLNELGSLPFYRCSALESVDFSGSPKFECDNAVIYETKDDGTKKVVECLECRGNSVGTGKIREEEMADVTEIAPHAFENCTGISQVYFGEAKIEAIPDYCFSGCTKLNYCEVSDYTKSIGEYAFQNTALSDIRLPSSVQLIPETAFVTTDENGVDSLLKGLNIQCEVPSAAYEFAKKYGFGTEDRIPHKYTVKFFNYDGTEELSSQLVEEGSDAVPPEAPVREGMVFTRWLPDYTDVSSDLNVYPQYEYEQEPEDPEDTRPRYTVTFYNYDGSMKISVQKVAEGDSARAPETIPERDGYTFTGWLPEYTNIISDLDVYPQYRQGTSGSTGDNNDDPNNPGGNGNGTGNNGSTGNNGTNGSNGANGNNGTNGNNGANGSGGTNNTGGSGNKGTVSGNGSGSGSSNKNNSQSSGTSVNVNKTGISNTGLVSATVNGSSDDYVVKISDSESARSAVEQALLNEYGSLDDIRYFAMDISLYDKTGTTKIQNTDGISVTITMPIPDALTSYAGNNKAGAVINGNTLEKLQAKFTTIDGVPCISFVATHFSPYTIYVDLNNMSATGTIDSTPVTGDPIHPKWFLSMGLALMSVILFIMKGSKKKVVRVIPG